MQTRQIVKCTLLGATGLELLVRKLCSFECLQKLPSLVTHRSHRRIIHLERERQGTVD